MARAVALCLLAFLWAPNYAACVVMGQVPSAGETAPAIRDQVDGGTENQEVEEAFPASTAMAESVSPESLSKLSECVASFVADDEIVGAELLVIKNGRTLLHRGYGWRDREGGVAMEPGGLFCVRSMTKSLIGTAVWMLADERKLKLSDPLAEYLPAFDVEGLRGITIAHLLRHRGGLPFSLLSGTDLGTIETIQDVARLVEPGDLQFTPGEQFSYSDQGTDSLAALIEVVAGQPVSEYVEQRILQPLGMSESTTLLEPGARLRDLAGPKYIGGRGAWRTFWTPEDASLFPCFLGSQGLYATAVDYAKFSQLWLKKGRHDGQRLVKSRSVRKAMAPNAGRAELPTGFPGLSTDYGDQFQLWTRPEEGGDGDQEVVVFGHGGSDGTHAWVFPEQDAIVMYFTQSRGNTTGIQLEEYLGELFLGVPFDPNTVAPPFEEFTGLYWEGPGDLHRAVVVDEGKLALEILGRARVELSYVGEDRWKFRQDPSIVMEFQRNSTGEVTGYLIGDHEEFRYVPSAELPTVEGLVERVRKAHGMANYQELTPLRIESDLVLEAFDMQGTAKSWHDGPNSYRVEAEIGTERECVFFNGKRAFQGGEPSELTELSADRTLQVSLDQYVVRFGGWLDTFEQAETVQVYEVDGQPVWLVRCGGRDRPAMVYAVRQSDSRVVREYGYVTVPGVGGMGRRLDLRDFRLVEGLMLPYLAQEVFPTPLIGTVRSQITVVECRAELPPGAFEVPPEPDQR